jgi:U3 small nucleolar RNA-associated protein 23
LVLLQQWICRQGDCKELISKLLGDPARVFTTKCVMQELRGLGPEYSETKQACKRYALHKCGHPDHTSAADCLISQIKNGNQEHFFIATQDRGLKVKVQSEPGGAIIFVSVNGVHLESPSEAQRKQVSRSIDVQQLPRPEEMKVQPPESVEEIRQTVRDVASQRNVFRRKRAKGPNPLSVKKRSSSSHKLERGNEDSKSQMEGKNKRKRQRRKTES